MMENSILATNNEFPGRKEHLHDLSRATRANYKKKEMQLLALFFF